jgi:hypothetical protein
LSQPSLPIYGPKKQQAISQQLVALAEATPAEKFAWCPAPGARSTSEVYMHIVEANFYVLSVTGPKMPSDLPEDSAKKLTSKPEVIAWLKRSLGAVKEAHLAEKPKDLQRKVHIADRVRRSTGCTYASSSTRTSIWDN